MAVGTYALITLQELKDQLGITVSTDDTQLERAIDRATARIEAFTSAGEILAAESTIERAGAAVETGRRFTAQPKGMAGEVTIYAITGMHPGVAGTLES